MHLSRAAREGWREGGPHTSDMGRLGSRLQRAGCADAFVCLQTIGAETTEVRRMGIDGSGDNTDVW